MPAAAAFDAKINARSEDLPLGGTAGMGFFHLYDIADGEIHNIMPPFPAPDGLRAEGKECQRLLCPDGS